MQRDGKTTQRESNARGHGERSAAKTQRNRKFPLYFCNIAFPAAFSPCVVPLRFPLCFPLRFLLRSKLCFSQCLPLRFAAFALQLVSPLCCVSFASKRDVAFPLRCATAALRFLYVNTLCCVSVAFSLSLRLRFPCVFVQFAFAFPLGFFCVSVALRSSSVARPLRCNALSLRCVGIMLRPQGPLRCV
jgi:hypothetical protein